MPAIVAAAVIAGGASVGGAAMASHAAGAAGKRQADAATRAAEIQAQSERDALAFKQQQAKQDQLNAETAQHANYDQWRAREGRLSSLGGLVGLSPRQIPDYVPMPTAAPMATPTAATTGTPTVGMRKTFPNGKVGMWDGKGWLAQ